MGNVVIKILQGNVVTQNRVSRAPVSMGKRDLLSEKNNKN